jgi:superfamily II DNA or RNA helicase
VSEITVQETPTRLRLGGSAADIKVLREHFKYRPPDYWRSAAYQLYQQTRADPRGPRGWDGYLHLVEYTKTGAEMLRGHKEALLAACADHGLEVRGTYLASPFIGLTDDDIPADVIRAPFQLDLHQRRCITNLLQAGVGVVRMATSAGKTAVFAAITAMVKARIPSARVLYVTPTERLVNQVTIELRKFLPGYKISQAGGGKRDFGGRDVVVATMATLSHNVAELHATGFFKSFLVLLCDECHHAGSAATWQKVIRLVPALFRFGASDTVKDERKEDVVAFHAIRGLFGPVRGEVGVTPLIEVGRVAKPHLHLVDVHGWSGQYDDVPQLAEPGSLAWCLLDGRWKSGTYMRPAVDHEDVDPLGRPNDLKGYHTVEFADRGEVDVESRYCLLRRTYDVAVINNKARKELVVAWAAYYARQGWPTLIVATRTLHVLILEELLHRAGLPVRTLTGEDTTRVRDETFAWLVAEPGRVLVSPLVKEGVSIPELKGGVVADVVVSPDLMRQIIGRFIRKKPTGGNEAHLTLFVDRQYKSARRASLRMIQELERIRGYTFFWPCEQPGQPAQRYEHASLA